MKDVAGAFNICEALLWGAIGSIFLWRSRYLAPGLSQLALITGITFLLFGVSDIVEVKTGAWWSPPWLFAWKVGCVLAFVAEYIHYKRITHQPQPRSHG